MQSKTSYFNPTLFKKNLTRFWPLWGGASLIGALAPLAMLVALVDAEFRSTIGSYEMTRALYDVLAHIVPGVSMVYAILCALAVWNYLYNARSVSLYHSLPITRKGLFCTNFLSGMAMMLIPYVITGALTILVFAAAGRFEPVGILVTILGVLGDSFFFFAFASFTAFITGNPFACAAFFLIFNFFFAAAEWLMDVLMSEFYYGVSQNYEGVLCFLSPVIYMSTELHSFGKMKDMVSPEGWIDHVYTSMRLENGWVIGVYALVGVVFLACAWMLYKRRRSESAGDVVAVGWMKPVFRYGVALSAAAGGGALLYCLFCQDFFQEGECANPVPMAVCMAIAGIVGYYIASMLLAKSLSVFRGSLKGAAGTAIAAVAVCCAVAADPFGVETWVPGSGDVTAVTATFHGAYGRGASATVEDPAAKQKILDAAILITEQADQLDRMRKADGDGYIHFTVTYRFQEGRPVYRYYRFPLSANEGITRMMAALASDPDLQEPSVFDRVTPAEDNHITSARLTGGYLDGLYSPADQVTGNLNLTLEQAQAVEEAVRRDIQAGRFGKTLYLPTYEEYASAAYTGELQLYYTLTRSDDPDRPEGYTYSDTVSIGLSTYCTETLQALEDLGVLSRERRLLTQAEQDALERREDGSWDFEGAVVYPGDFTVYPENTAVSTVRTG